ncbi:MAG: hypothetical protein ACO1N4_10330 [Pedobacter sp.]|jgi:hypothetical protein
MTEHLETFRTELLTYYQDYLLMADFTANGKLLLLAKPFVDFHQIIMDLCDNMIDMVHFREHLDVHLYQFGKNELVEIAIN